MLRSPHKVSWIRRASLVFSLWAITSLMISACSVGDFIGAYFNTFYNAQRQFREAEDELLAQPDTRQKELPFGFAYNVQGGTKTKFAGVIEKCSKLLQYHPESNLVDDALLMIGKSYYYQNDYQPAERKFKELIEQFPTSDLAYEARLLLGYTYYGMNDKPGSSAAAKGLLEEATSNEENEYVAKASVLLAQLEIENKNTDLAIAYYQSAAEKSVGGDERCAAYLSLANLLAQTSNNRGALEAYRDAEEASVSYQANYKGRIGQARMLSKLGQYEESLDLLRDLLSSSIYREYLGEISLEIGNIFKESKDYASAIDQYSYVDTTYARTEASANSYFQLGDLFEKKLFQMDSAYARYSKGKTEYPQAAITTLLLQRSDYLAKYLQYRNEIRRLDSIKTAWLSPRDTSRHQQAAPPDSLHGDLPEHPDSAVVTNPLVPSAAADSSKQDSEKDNPLGSELTVLSSDSTSRQTDSARTQTPVLPQISLDSANVRMAIVEAELASLLYTSMNLPDSAEQWYLRLLKDHASSPQVPRALFTLAQIYSLDSTRSRVTSDSLYNEAATRFPDSEFGEEANKVLGRPGKVKVSDPAEGAYARAEKLLEADQTEAARDSLRSITLNYASSPISPKAHYALGWTYERVGARTDSAISTYKRLVTLFPSSRYALAVKPKLDQYEIDLKAKEQHLKDSLAARTRDSTSSSPKDSVQVKGGWLETEKGKPDEQKQPEDSSATEKKE